MLSSTDLETVIGFTLMAVYDRKVTHRDFFESVMGKVMRMQGLIHEVRLINKFRTLMIEKGADGTKLGETLKERLGHIEKLRGLLYEDIQLLAKMPYSGDTLH